MGLRLDPNWSVPLWLVRQHARSQRKTNSMLFFSCESQHSESPQELIKISLTVLHVLPFSQISRFTEIILDKDNDEEYKYFRVDEDFARPTLLHLAAEQNFLHVTKLLVEKYPSLVYLETEEVAGERPYLPAEKALMSHKDETAAYLISQMKHDWSVQEPC